MARQKIERAALEEMIVGIARSQPTTADVCEVTLHCDPPPQTAGGEAPGPGGDWFVQSFRREEERRATTDDDAVARELRDIAESLRQTYRVEGA